MKFIRSEMGLLAVASLLAVSLAHAQATEPGEEWQMTMSVKMAGMSMPGQKINQCVALTQQTVAPEAPNKNCTSTVTSQTATSVSVKFVCTGKDAMEGTGTFSRTGKTMKGLMAMKTKDGDEMQMDYTGVNTGKTCDAKAAQRQANAMVAQGAAELDKFCAESVAKGGQAMLVFGDQPVCKDPKYTPIYCKNISGEKGYMMLRTEETTAKAASTPNMVPKIEAACKVSMPAMNKQLCASAEQRKSWTFLAQECDVEAKALAAKQCAGRGYTAMSTSPYKDFCAAFSGAVASDEVADQPAAEVKPPESKTKRTLKGLKGVLGY